jgi:hypothetical protein
MYRKAAFPARGSFIRPRLTLGNASHQRAISQPVTGALLKLFLTAILVLVATISAARAQSNYEIQVYGADTVAPRTTMVEVHSNFTADGQRKFVAGMEPTNHAEHETLEITQGINNWTEVGFYVFTSTRDGQGVQWVGDHIRPRVRVPESWHWPVGVSLSTEVGYQRARFGPDTWNWEIRPIVDKQKGLWYFAVNPALERTWHGPDVNLGIDFSPAAKISYDFTKKITGGLEYYADYGSITNIASFHDQQQQFFPAIDLNLSPDWEFNFGVGIGPTAATDHWIVKCIVGRRFSWGPKHK